MAAQNRVRFGTDHPGTPGSWVRSSRRKDQIDLVEQTFEEVISEGLLMMRPKSTAFAVLAQVFHCARKTLSSRPYGDQK